MKILTLLIFIALSLFSRENPFEPTQEYNDKKNQLLEQQKTTIVKDEIKETEVIEVNQTNETISKIITLKDGCKNSYKFTPLDFMEITLIKDKIRLVVDKKYPMINQDIHSDIKKFVFDFKSKKSFYTIKESLCNNYFKSFSVGSHFKRGYLRVVIETTKQLDQYVDIIDPKNNIIEINYK